jgi:hypothetical protein
VHRGVNSVKITPKGTGCEVMDSIYSALGMDKCQAILNTVMNLQFP